MGTTFGRRSTWAKEEPAVMKFYKAMDQFKRYRMRT